MMREKLAEIAHEQWTGWMEYMLDECAKANKDGSVTIDAHYIERWRRQMATPYAELQEYEKDSDRREADKFIEVMKES